MKLVINTCWGGFGISRAAAEHMAANGSERAKQELLQNPNKWYGYGYVEGMSGPDDYTYSRHDPLLVAAVEALGEKANGKYADLKVVEIPDGIEYYIEEYDGKEWVAEKHRTWG